MSRIIHFGVVRVDGQTNGADLHVLVDLLHRSPFQVVRSFTDWNEQVGEQGDAIHVVHVTDCDYEDEDGTRIRLSPEEVAEVREELSELIDDLNGRQMIADHYRLVDYAVEDDAQEWGSDTFLHGLWALRSVPGRSI